MLARALQKNFSRQELSYVRNSGRESRAKGMHSAPSQGRAVFATLDANRAPRWRWRCSQIIAGDAQAVARRAARISWAPHTRPHGSGQCGFVQSSATVCERGTASSWLPLRVLTDAASHATWIRRPCRASPLLPPLGDRPCLAGRAARRRQPKAAPAPCNPRAAPWCPSEWRQARHC
jgi:hypothetical protein